MHDWGDENFDWNGLNEAVRYVGHTCRKYGFIPGDYKEKWGTLRFYAHFGHLSLHAFIYPGYVYSQFPKWLWKLDCMYIGPILRKLFEKPFVWWQCKVYTYAYRQAIKKWPHLYTEITCCMEQKQLAPEIEAEYLRRRAAREEREKYERELAQELHSDRVSKVAELLRDEYGPKNVEGIGDITNAIAVTIVDTVEDN